METYHKIQTAYLRDPETKFKTLLKGEWAKPEFGWLANNEWVATEKVDGTNIRVMWDGSNVSFNGKTDNAQMHRDLYVYLQENFTAEKMAAQFGTETTQVCCYGEGFGAGIRTGGYYQESKEFILFDVLIGDIWLERINVEDVARGLQCRLVPIVMTGTLPEILAKAEAGYNSLFAEKEHLAEGFVIRPAVELRNRRGERVITKIKHADFR